jgi:hypothetical protein
MKKPKRRQVMKKSEFAALLALSRGRVSQLVQAGLPTLKDGRIDRDRGLAWYRSNIVRPAPLAEVGSAAAMPGVPVSQVGPAAGGRGRAAAGPTPLTAARTRREVLQGDLLEEEIATRKKRRILPGDAATIAGRLWGAYWEILQMTSLHAANELVGIDGLSWITVHEAIQNNLRYRSRVLRQICEGLDGLADGSPEQSTDTAPGTIDAPAGFVPIAEVDQLLVALITETRDALLQIPATVPRDSADAVSTAIRDALTRLSQWKLSAEGESNHAKTESSEVRAEKPSGPQT